MTLHTDFLPLSQWHRTACYYIGQQCSLRSIYYRIRLFGLQSHWPLPILSVTQRHWGWDCTGVKNLSSGFGRRIELCSVTILFIVPRWTKKSSRKMCHVLERNMNAQNYIHNVLESYSIYSSSIILDLIHQKSRLGSFLTFKLLFFPRVSYVSFTHWTCRGRLGQLSYLIIDLHCLRHEVEVPWGSILQEDIDILVWSMSQRIEECNNLKGTPTSYSNLQAKNKEVFLKLWSFDVIHKPFYLPQIY